jgi:histone-lysine N-methyltransferase SETMAR
VLSLNSCKRNSAGDIYERLPEAKLQSVEWHYTTSPKKKRKTVPSACKIMGTVLWDSEGCILVDFLEKGETIIAARYVREKRPKKKTVILQHDNARPHTARLTLQTIQKDGWEPLSHPPCSTDLTPSDYHLFGPLKYHLRGHHYGTDEAVQEAVLSWLRGAGTDIYCRGILRFHNGDRNA